MIINTTLCYVRDGDRTLMLHRIKKNQDVHQGKWNGLGGKMEDRESPEDCVIREVFEESGLTISAPRLRGVLTFPDFKGDETWLMFLFTATQFSGTLHAECAEGILEWVPTVDIPKLNLWDGDRVFLEWIQDENSPFFTAKFQYENQQFVDHSVIFY